MWPRYPANFWLHLARRNFVVVLAGGARCQPLDVHRWFLIARQILSLSTFYRPILLSQESFARWKSAQRSKRFPWKGSFLLPSLNASISLNIAHTPENQKIVTPFTEKSPNLPFHFKGWGDRFDRGNNTEIHRAQIAFLSWRRPARSITFYFCVAEQSSGLVRYSERTRASFVEHSRYLSRRAFQNNFFLPVAKLRLFEEPRARVRSVSSIHRDFFYLAAVREDVTLKYRHDSLVLVTLSFPGFARRNSTDPPLLSFSLSSLSSVAHD